MGDKIPDIPGDQAKHYHFSCIFQQAKEAIEEGAGFKKVVPYTNVIAKEQEAAE